MMVGMRFYFSFLTEISIGMFSSGTAAMYESHASANNYADDVLDDLFSTPSKASMAL